VDPAAGIVLHKKLGDPVAAGEPLCFIHGRTRESLERAESEVLKAYTIGDEPVPAPPLVVDRM
jgi:thymidine phosphorylase